jgi:CO/xanthine dehydrogenase FAD-binding subunit
VEFGAAVPLQAILRLGANNLPLALAETIRGIGRPAIRGLATLGGNLAIAGRLMSAAPVLALLDARAELRRHGAARWVPIVRLHRQDGSVDIGSSEVIARVRVPLYPWSVQVYRRFGSIMAPDSHPLSFCGLARVSNRIVEELRVVGSTAHSEMLRYKEVEADLVGRRLPLSEREINTAVDAFATSDMLDAIQEDRLKRLVQWFLLNLHTL